MASLITHHSSTLLTTLTLIFIFILLLSPTPTHAFGYVSNPSSRQSSCVTLAAFPDEDNSSSPPSPNFELYQSLCDGCQDEPHRVGSLAGVPFSRDVGPHLCNGGASHWDGLNTQGPGIWPTTTFTSPLTEPITVEWELLGTAVHAKFEYYISRQGLDPNGTVRLTKDDFVTEPVLETTVLDEVGHGIIKHQLTPEIIPEREGYVVIFAVFNSVNGKDAYYNCLDLMFEKSSATTKGSKSDRDEQRRRIYVQNEV